MSIWKQRGKRAHSRSRRFKAKPVILQIYRHFPVSVVFDFVDPVAPLCGTKWERCQRSEEQWLGCASCYRYSSYAACSESSKSGLWMWGYRVVQVFGYMEMCFGKKMCLNSYSFLENLEDFFLGENAFVGNSWPALGTNMFSGHLRYLRFRL